MKGNHTLFSSTKAPTEKKLSTRLFRTPTAKEITYPFIKKLSNFINEKELKNPGNSSGHCVWTRNKKRKPDDIWFITKDNNITKENSARLNAFTVTSGENYNFKFGATKYRIVRDDSDEKKVDFIISKGLPHFEDFYDFMDRTKIYKKQNPNETELFDDSGRVLLSEVIWQQNDLSNCNIGFTGSKLASDSKGGEDDVRMTAIDPVQAFWELTAKFISLNNNHQKKIAQVYVPSNHNQGNYIIVRFNQNKNFIGNFTSKNYIEFPITQVIFSSDDSSTVGYFPFMSLNRQYYNYAKKLHTNKRFLNEKYLQTFKELITQQMTLELAEIHIAHDEDRLELKTHITGILNNLLKIAKNSIEFKEYLIAHATLLVKTVLYEIKIFLLKNKHYRFLTVEDERLQWNAIISVTLTEFRNLMRELNLYVISSQLQELNDFGNSITSQKDLTFENGGIKEVHHYYLSQSMKNRAQEMEKNADKIYNYSAKFYGTPTTTQSISSSSSSSLKLI